MFRRFIPKGYAAKDRRAAHDTSIDLLASFRSGPGAKPRPTEQHLARTAVIMDKLEPVSREEALRRRE